MDIEQLQDMLGQLQEKIARSQDQSRELQALVNKLERMLTVHPVAEKALITPGRDLLLYDGRRWYIGWLNDAGVWYTEVGDNWEEVHPVTHFAFLPEEPRR